MSKSTWQDALVHGKETKPKPLLLPKDDQQLVRDGVKTQLRSVVSSDITIIFNNLVLLGEIKEDFSDFNNKHWDLLPTQVGDVFYLQEEFSQNASEKIVFKDNLEFEGEHKLYRWQEASQMPIEHVRTFLEVTEVRIELLEDISLEDCLNFGVDRGLRRKFVKDTFITYWNSTHPDGQKFGDGIYVEVVTFKLIEKEIK